MSWPYHPTFDDLSIDPTAQNTYLTPSNDDYIRTIARNNIEISLLEQTSCQRLHPNEYSQFRNTFINNVKLNNASLHQSVQNIRCSIESYINGPHPSDRIHTLFSNIQTVGDSTEGVVIATGRNFIIKTPHDNLPYDTIAHEATIGLLALNKLQEYIPNFMLIYDYFRCSPLIYKNNEVQTWCYDGKKVGYLVAERINNSISLNDTLKTDISPIEVANIFLQIINALYFAFKTYNFTHYDLHYKNVLIRKSPRLLSIPLYNLQGNIRGYINTYYLVTIIDYGFSYIKLPTIDLGTFNIEESRNLQPFPLFDIFKVLAYSYNLALHINNLEHMQTLAKFITFLPIELTPTWLNTNRSRYYAAPESLRSRTWSEYFQHLENQTVFHSCTLQAQGIILPLKNNLTTHQFLDIISDPNYVIQDNHQYCIARHIPNIRFDDKAAHESAIVTITTYLLEIDNIYNYLATLNLEVFQSTKDYRIFITSMYKLIYNITNAIREYRGIKCVNPNADIEGFRVQINQKINCYHEYCLKITNDYNESLIMSRLVWKHLLQEPMHNIFNIKITEL